MQPIMFDCIIVQTVMQMTFIADKLDYVGSRLETALLQQLLRSNDIRLESDWRGMHTSVVVVSDAGRVSGEDGGPSAERADALCPAAEWVECTRNENDCR